MTAPRLDIVRWSTSAVPESLRYDYFVEALSSALIPMQAQKTIACRVRSEIASVDIGGTTFIRQFGSPHESFRTNRDLSRSGDHTFHLICNVASTWTFEHRGRIRLGPGDAVLTDSNIGHHLEMLSDYDVVHIKLSPQWIARWLSDPSNLVGVRIPASEPWGRMLTSYIANLSPDFLASSPVPPRVVGEHIGALLALVESTRSRAPVRATSQAARLRTQIEGRVADMCAKHRLCADDIALAMGLPAQHLHACLASFGDTFVDLLVRTRLAVAVRMLESPIFARLSVAEIAMRAGFPDARLLSRTLRRREGRTPVQVRRDLRHPSDRDPSGSA